MFEPHVSSTPYFVGIDHGKVVFGVDILMVNPLTNVVILNLRAVLHKNARDRQHAKIR